MVTINPVLSFNGNSIFTNQFSAANLHLWDATKICFLPDSDKKIMHIAYSIGNKTILMGSDTSQSCGGATRHIWR